MDPQQRIDNFRKMAQDDPDNELGHFSLGKALLDAGQHDEAITALQRVITLKPSFSKAYQHLGEAFKELGQEQQAIETLTSGYTVAAERGDVIPRDAMAALLQALGTAPPIVEKAVDTSQPVGTGAVRCCRCGIVGAQLAAPPFKTELGQQIMDNVCQACWQEWIGMGVKVINELRLDFANPAASEVYDAHMKEFLQLS